MSRRTVRISLVVTCCLMLVGPIATAAPGDVGTTAADFSLQVFGGGTQSLSQHSGKVTMLFIVGYG